MPRVCYKCGKIIEPNTKAKMHPLERPYGNFFFHLACYLEVGDVDEYLATDLKKLDEYLHPSKTTLKARNVVQLESRDKKVNIIVENA